MCFYTSCAYKPLDVNESNPDLTQKKCNEPLTKLTFVTPMPPTQTKRKTSHLKRQTV